MRLKGHCRYGKYAKNWPFTDRFGIEFVGRWMRLRGACLIEVHLHDKSFGGNVKWPLKTGECLIQVAASAVTRLFTQKPVPPGTIRTNGNFLLGRFTRDNSHKW